MSIINIRLSNLIGLIFLQSLFQPIQGPGLSQGRYLNTGQHKHRIKAHTDIHVLSGIQTHDPSFRASEDSSCLRPRGHCDRQVQIMKHLILQFALTYYFLVHKYRYSPLRFVLSHFCCSLGMRVQVSRPQKTA
jgi:hypothetical protein